MRGNSISIKGNITGAAEARAVSGGERIVASFGLAWNERKRDGHEWKDVPSYFDVKVWMSDRQAQGVVPQLVKGAQCAIIDGHIVQERWEAKDGSARSKVVVMVDDPYGGLMVSPRAGQRNPIPQAPAAKQEPRGGVYGQDIPF